MYGYEGYIMNMKEASNGYEDMREMKTHGVKKEYGMHGGMKQGLRWK